MSRLADTLSQTWLTIQSSLFPQAGRRTGSADPEAAVIGGTPYTAPRRGVDDPRQISRRFTATNLRRDTIKAYPLALSLSKPVLSLPKGVERVSRSWFDKALLSVVEGLTTNGLTCPALSW
jgi:hypothetical protein